MDDSRLGKTIQSRTQQVRLLPQPVNQFIAVRCREDGIQGMVIIAEQVYVCSSNQMQVVVTQHTDGTVTQVAYKT